MGLAPRPAAHRSSASSPAAESPGVPAGSRQTRRQTLLVVATLAVILLGATALRFVDLSSNPGGLYPDEAAEALSARRILNEPGYRPVLLEDNGGREALWAYILAGAFLVGGDTPHTLHATAAIVGVLGVLAIWLLARRFGEGAGLAAAAWAAGALWLVSMSRVGFRATLVPLLAATALLALVAWLDRPSRQSAVIAGGATALAALYTYQPMRLLPIAVVLTLLSVRKVDAELFRRLRRSLAIFVTAFAVVAAPMVVTALTDPQIYLGRAIGVTPFNPGLSAEDPVTHTLRTLGMFGFTGDPNPRHNVDALPLLTWPLALVALGGLLVLWRDRRTARNALVVWSLPVLLLPPVIATEGSSPHFLRSVGLAAPLAVTIGVGTDVLSRGLFATLSRVRGEPRTSPGRVSMTTAIGIGLVALAFLLLGVSTASSYLSRPLAERYAAFSVELVAMAELARPSDALILDDFSTLTLQYLLGESMPERSRPGEPLEVAGVDRVLARTREDLRASLGDVAAASAKPVAWDPQGQPTVWAAALPTTAP